MTTLNHPNTKAKMVSIFISLNVPVDYAKISSVILVIEEFVLMVLDKKGVKTKRGVTLLDCVNLR